MRSITLNNAWTVSDRMPFALLALRLKPLGSEGSEHLVWDVQAKFAVMDL